MPQGKAKLVFSTAPKRPVKPRPQLRLAYFGPPIEIDRAALEREIAEVEERLFALRAKLSGLTIVATKWS